MPENENQSNVENETLKEMLIRTLIAYGAKKKQSESELENQKRDNCSER